MKSQRKMAVREQRQEQRSANSLLAVLSACLPWGSRDVSRVNVADILGDTPLHRQATQGEPVACEALIQLGANVNASNFIGRTPLHEAVQHGHIEVCRVLLRAHADINARDSQDGQTPLHLASRRHDILTILVREGTCDVNARDNNGQTVLHLAANNRYGGDEICRTLLRHRAEVNAVDCRNRTPLHLAASIWVRTARELIEANANVNAQDSQGDTPLHLAAENHFHQDTVQLLIRNGADVNIPNHQFKTPLFKAVDGPNPVECCEILLNANADINIVDNEGNTPLHLAAVLDRTDVCRLLITRGANVNARNSEEKTPLHKAAGEGRSEVCELLLSMGALVNEKDRNGITPLHEVVCRGHKTTFGVLMRQSIVNPNVSIRFDGKTLLHVVAATLEPEIFCREFLELLIEAGFEVDARDEPNGDTCLHLVAQRGYSEACSLLLARNADVHAVNNRSYTPLHFAARSGNALMITSFLRRPRINLDMQNDDGDTPLHIAARSGFIDVCMLLTERGCNPRIRNSQMKKPINVARNRKTRRVLAKAVKRYKEQQANSILHGSPQGA